MKKIVIISLLLISTALFGIDSLAAGKSWYNKRHLGALGTTAAAEPIEKAITNLTLALDNNKSQEEALVWLLKSIHFKGDYVLTEKKAKMAAFKGGYKLAENYLDTYPDNLDLKYWYIVLVGQWANLGNPIAAAREGVVDILKNNCLEIIAKSPAYDKGAAHLFMGRMHHKTPRIPFFMTWPSLEKGASYLKEAIKLDPGSIIARVYLAENYLEQKKDKEAENILYEALKLPFQKDHLLEGKRNKEIAAELLEKLKKR